MATRDHSKPPGSGAQDLYYADNHSQRFTESGEESVGTRSKTRLSICGRRHHIAARESVQQWACLCAARKAPPRR